MTSKRELAAGVEDLRHRIELLYEREGDQDERLDTLEAQFADIQTVLRITGRGLDCLADWMAAHDAASVHPDRTPTMPSDAPVADAAARESETGGDGGGDALGALREAYAAWRRDNIVEQPETYKADVFMARRLGEAVARCEATAGQEAGRWERLRANVSVLANQMGRSTSYDHGARTGLAKTLALMDELEREGGEGT